MNIIFFSENEDSNAPLISLPNYTIPTDLFFNDSDFKEDTVLVTSSSKIANKINQNHPNESFIVAAQQNRSIHTKTELDALKPVRKEMFYDDKIRVENNTIYFGNFL